MGGKKEYGLYSWILFKRAVTIMCDRPIDARYSHGFH